MAVREGCSGGRTSSGRTHWDVICSATALSSAACEWFLILLLFIHGLLSYFMREFARYCKLPTPCLLCSRLDHYFSTKVPESYQSMFCQKHGLEIFSHVVCDDCLFSWAEKENSKIESQKLSMNKTSKTLCQPNKRINGCNEQSAFGSVGRRACSCCGKIWTSRQAQRGAIRYRSPVRGSKPNIPLPNVPSRKNLNHRDNMRRKREKSYGSLSLHHIWNNMLDPSASTGYRAVKVTSDSESEAPFSDSGDGRIMAMEAETHREDNELRNTSQSLADAQSNILAHLKPASKTCTPANLGADEGVVEIKMSADVQNSCPPALPELISLDNNPRKSNPLNDELPCETTGKDPADVSVTLTSNPVIQLDASCLADLHPSTNHIELPVKESSETLSINGAKHDTVQHTDTLNATLTSVEDKLDDDAQPSSSNEQTTSYRSLSISNSSKVMETSVSAVKDKTMNRFEEKSELSSTVDEHVDTVSATFTSVEEKFDYDAQPSVANEHATSYRSLSISNSSKVMETSAIVVKDKIMNGFEEQSQLSSTVEEYVFGTKPQSNIVNSRSQSDHENFDITHGTATGECMTPREADSSERNESAFESTAGSVVSDREGESLVDRLKRQIEYDKERIASLYKELDEERSASAIAANQAMAMITRLQEEKAALNMDALHYLRGMEEQAEYDVEALEKANDLLSEKEKEIQDLEAELEFYRSKVSEELINEPRSEGSDAEIRDQIHPKYSNVPEFEEEKLYISECLKRLEQKLLKLTGFRAAALVPNGVNYEKMEVREPNGSLPGDYYEDGEFPNQNESQVSSGNNKVLEVKKPDTIKRDDSDKHNGSEEMEANQECCELSLESHQMGNEGLLIIEEIAHQLQELRKLVLKGRCVVP